MDHRARRILDSAVQLAAAGGFSEVRLREVANHAGVALGTVYKHFTSKEDMLLAVLEEELQKLQQVIALQPPQGETPLERLCWFFDLCTEALFQQPQLARALLRSVTSADEQLAAKVLRFHERMSALITAAVRGAGPDQPPPAGMDEAVLERIGFLLQQIWFAVLVGWMGGLYDGEEVRRQTRSAAAIVLEGTRNGLPGG